MHAAQAAARGARGGGGGGGERGGGAGRGVPAGPAPAAAAARRRRRRRAAAVSAAAVVAPHILRSGAGASQHLGAEACPSPILRWRRAPRRGGVASGRPRSERCRRLQQRRGGGGRLSTQPGGASDPTAQRPPPLCVEGGGASRVPCNIGRRRRHRRCGADADGSPGRAGCYRRPGHGLGPRCCRRYRRRFRGRYPHLSTLCSPGRRFPTAMNPRCVRPLTHPPGPPSAPLTAPE